MDGRAIYGGLALLGWAVVGGVSAETLTVSMSTHVADASKSYSAVEVTCDATISGTLNLDDGATVSVTAGTATFSGTVRLGTSAAGTVTIAPAGGATASFTGKMTGPAAVDVNGAGKTYFTSDTSDYDGNLTISLGEFHAKGTAPFGSTNGYTYFKGTTDESKVISFDGVTTSEDLRISAGANAYGKRTVRFTENCTFNGPFTASADTWEWWVFASDKSIVFNGPFTGYSALLGDDYGGNPAVTWNGTTTMGTMYWKNGTLNFNHPIEFAQNSNHNNFHIRGGTTYNLNCANVFGDAAYSSRIQWENANVAACTLNVASNDQYFAYLLYGDYSAKTTIYSANDATVHLACGAAYSSATSSQQFRGTFTGRVGLSVEGALPLALYGKSTTSGTLALSSGAQVTLGSGSGWVGGISLAHADGGEVLTLNGGDLSVQDLWIAGQRVAGGTYGSSSSAAEHKLACFAGAGVITVPNAPLVISEDTTIPAEGITCSGVKVTGTATVDGGMITVDEDGSLSFEADAAFTCPVRLGASTKHTVRLVPSAGVTARFSGEVSGLSDLVVDALAGTGVVVFDGANTFDGNLTISCGKFRAVGAGAFGSTAGYTTIAGASDRLISFEDVTTSEDLRISQGGSWGVDCVQFRGACTFNGPVTASLPGASEWWWFGPDAQVTFNGEFSGFGAILGGDRGSAPTVTWNGPTSQRCHYWQWGTVNHTTPISLTQRADRDNLHVRGGGTYNLYCADVFGTADYSARMQWEAASAASRTTVFNVVSNDQHLAYFLYGTWSAGTKFRSETEGVTIHLESGTGYTGVPSAQEFKGVFAGTVGLSVEGPLPLTLSGVSTSSGMLALTNGASVTIPAGGSWKGAVAIANGDGSSESLTVADGLVVEAIYTNGVRLASGQYGALGSSLPNQLPFLKGSGSLFVQPSILEVESDYVVAAAGETYAGVRVKGAATISGGPLVLCGDATVAAEANATFTCPVALDGVSFTIAPVANVTVEFNGPISGTAPITINGAGAYSTVYFRGANTFDGDLRIVKGAFHAASDGALGSTVGKTYFYGTGDIEAKTLDNHIYFHNVTTAENVEITQGFGQRWWDANNIFFFGTNTFTGAWTAAAEMTEFGWIFMPGSSTSFNGELKGFSYFFGHNSFTGYDGDPKPVITFNCSPVFKNYWYGSGVVYNYNAQMTCSSVRLRGGTHNLNCEDVFLTGRTFYFEHKTDLRMNLNGGDQHFRLMGGADNSVWGVIASESGWTFHLAGTDASTYKGIFAGNVNFSVEGPAATLLEGVSTSTGTLVATNGANITLAAGSAWAGGVRIAPASRVILNGAALTAETEVQITGNGVVEVAPGVVQKLGAVYVDGRPIPGGTYSATSGSAKYRVYFPGEGLVKLPGEGSVLIFR